MQGQLEKLQRPLRFTMHHETIGLSEEGTVATRPRGFSYSVVCGEHEMRRGQHYAAFTLRSGATRVFLGVVGPSFDPTTDDATDGREGIALSHAMLSRCQSARSAAAPRMMVDEKSDLPAPRGTRDRRAGPTSIRRQRRRVLRVRVVLLARPFRFRYL